eukprot:CAMPEP_0198139066 /NCGR_PEP_ID=MMETSP1443-20131203/2405_1 /TAXON_ID=186043 /ORGANISM="Entomoneis sp., Strain CCMP2396" /LENGTH=46 /DNA_ID= /DNA_START= /DNA_END= /DNA_ORIENTATION=
MAALASISSLSSLPSPLPSAPVDADVDEMPLFVAAADATGPSSTES